MLGNRYVHSARRVDVRVRDILRMLSPMQWHACYLVLEEAGCFRDGDLRRLARENPAHARNSWHEHCGLAAAPINAVCAGGASDGILRLDAHRGWWRYRNQIGRYQPAIRL